MSTAPARTTGRGAKRQREMTPTQTSDDTANSDPVDLVADEEHGCDARVVRSAVSPTAPGLREDKGDFGGFSFKHVEVIDLC